jgi:uncharacterized protein YjbI with pentapeptide repeats
MSQVSNTDELTRAYAAGERDFAGSDLRCANLAGVDLSRINLQGAILVDADLDDCCLDGANLRNADLAGAELNNAELRSADLTETNLSGAILSGAQLERADLSETTLEAAQLDEARLVGTKLINVNLCYTDFSSADLSDADLSGSRGVGTDFTGATLENTKLLETDLRYAVFENARLDGETTAAVRKAEKRTETAQAKKQRSVERILARYESGLRDFSAVDLSFADLEDVNLEGADLSSANLENANLMGAELNQCCLDGANLRRANCFAAEFNRSSFHGGDLREATLSSAEFEHALLGWPDGDPETQMNEARKSVPFKYRQPADLEEADLEEAILTGALLEGVNLSYADLESADLEKACLDGANLAGARLCKANLKKSSLIGADLSGADLERADLSKADLEEANLFGAVLNITQFHDANLENAEIQNVNLSELENAKINDGALKRAVDQSVREKEKQAEDEAVKSVSPEPAIQKTIRAANTDLPRSVSLGTKISMFCSHWWTSNNIFFILLMALIFYIYSGRDSTTPTDAQSEYWFYVAFGIPVAIGLFIVGRSVLRQARLLREGHLTQAVLRGTSRGEGQSSTTGIFHFIDNQGKRCVHESQTRPENAKREWILFHPEKPKIAWLVQDTSVKVTVAENGALCTTKVPRAWSGLITSVVLLGGALVLVGLGFSKRSAAPTRANRRATHRRATHRRTAHASSDNRRSNPIGAHDQPEGSPRRSVPKDTLSSQPVSSSYRSEPKTFILRPAELAPAEKRAYKEKAWHKNVIPPPRQTKNTPQKPPPPIRAEDTSGHTVALWRKARTLRVGMTWAEVKNRLGFAPRYVKKKTADRVERHAVVYALDFTSQQSWEILIQLDSEEGVEDISYRNIPFKNK